MTRLADLARFRAAFFIEHRAHVGFYGSMDLLGTLAHAVPEVKTDDRAIPLHPLWSGILLSFDDAMRRFGRPQVEGFVVGTASAAQRDQFVEAVLRSPPRGLVGVDDNDPTEQRLPLYRWLAPRVIIERGEIGRRFSALSGVDILGFRDEFDEIWPFPTGDDWDGEHVADGLLRHLALNASRRFQSVAASGSHDDLVAHAAELLGLGAISAAGAVAGVAFERLLRRAAGGSLRVQIDQGKRVPLHQIISAVAPATGDERLMAFKQLRNDIAHTLGSGAGAAGRSDAELYDDVAKLVAFLDRQTDAEHVCLVDADPRPVLSPRALHLAALAEADAAAAATQPYATQVGEGTVADGLFGTAHVAIRDSRLAFTKWLVEAQQVTVDCDDAVVKLSAPHTHLDRALAWCWGYTERLLENDVPCGYAGQLS